MYTYIVGEGCIESRYLSIDFFIEIIQVTEGRMLTSPVPSHTASHPAKYLNWCIKRAFTVEDAFEQFCG